MALAVRKIKSGNAFSICALQENNRCDLVEFLSEVDDMTRARLVRTIERIADFGPLKNLDVVKPLGNKLFEMKISWVRIVFFYDEAKLIICTHAFRKDSQKTPKRELSRAQSLMKLYFCRRATEGIQFC